MARRVEAAPPPCVAAFGADSSLHLAKGCRLCGTRSRCPDAPNSGWGCWCISGADKLRWRAHSVMPPWLPRPKDTHAAKLAWCDTLAPSHPRKRAPFVPTEAGDPRGSRQELYGLWWFSSGPKSVFTSNAPAGPQVRPLWVQQNRVATTGRWRAPHRAHSGSNQPYQASECSRATVAAVSRQSLGARRAARSARRRRCAPRTAR